MSGRWWLFLVLLVVLVLVVRENMTDRPEKLYQLTSGQVDMCLSCHVTEKLDPAHDTKIMGCASCHLGNPLAIDMKAAHQGMVLNPGDLRVVERTCGVEGCHAPDVHKVKNSLMATNRGILATLLYYWGEAPDQEGDFSVEKLLASGDTSLALDYYRKLCATCHLWQPKGEFPGFFGEKGGGCTACHYTRPDDPTAIKPWDRLQADNPLNLHPFITSKVPTENCLRCHNRSGRIGLSYIGIYESEGYGTPYVKGRMSPKKLPGDRFYQELPADIHHQKGMACIDCHTQNEIMGDGTSYVRYEDAVEIQCITCHTAGRPGTTRKNNQLNNIKEIDGKFVLVGKLEGSHHPLNPPKSGVCDYDAHQRLSCESCHSTWVPQCYGCHVKRDMRDTHLDKLTMEETPGWWEEGRSYIRFEQPTLAVWGDEIVVVTPGCQSIVTLIDQDGKMEKAFNSLTMAGITPHTTQKVGRSCVDCHTSTKTVGLGEGTVWQENGKWYFNPVHQGVETAAGLTPPLDGYVDIHGQPLQKSNRPDLRPFNQQELARILRVGQCLACHTDFNDPIYKNYSLELKCPVFVEGGSK